MSRLDWYRIVVFIHVTAVVMTLGPAVAQSLLGSRIRGAPQPARLSLAEITHVIGDRIIGPGLGVVLVTGLVGVAVHPTIRYEDAWVGLGIALWLALMAIGLFALRPASQRMLVIHRSLTGSPSDEQATQLEALGKRSAAFGGVSHLLLVVAIFVMVWKPGA